MLIIICLLICVGCKAFDWLCDCGTCMAGQKGATGIVTAEMVLMNKNVKTEHLLVRKLSTTKNCTKGRLDYHLSQ